MIFMDTAQVATIVTVAIGIIAILLGIFGLMWQINSQSSRLEAKIEAQGTRVSQAELDQARINGINSVLLQQTHTHESRGNAD